MDHLTAAVFLLLLHAPDGQEIRIAPDQVTSLHAPRTDPSSQKHFAPTVHCLINLTDGKFVSVVEECPQIQKLLEERK